jgi:TonB family protein
VRPVCGIFKQAQLSEQFLKYAAATLIVTSSLTSATYGQEKVKSDSLVEAHFVLDTANEDSVFGMFVEFGAEPVGGYYKFMEALSKEIKYPTGLTTKGKCFVEFFIDTTGQTTDFKVIRSFNKASDQEVLRALTKLNYPWKPARQKNKPIKSRFVIPIAFDPDHKKKN